MTDSPYPEHRERLNASTVVLMVSPLARHMGAPLR